MKLPVSRPTVSQAWARAKRIPFGKRIFSRMIGRLAPYTGTVGATVLELDDGFAKVELRDRRGVRNHLNSIHAVALMNLGEVATGLSVLHALDGRGRGIVTALRMEYLKKARGTIIATCRVSLDLTPGKQVVEVPGELCDASGQVVARAYASWKLDVE